MIICHVFVLTSLSIDEHGDVKRRNVAVTFDLFEAEDHRNEPSSTNMTFLSCRATGARMQHNRIWFKALRDLREMVRQRQEER